MSREVVISKNVIIAYLGNYIKPDNVYAMYEIKNGNKELLYEHINALYNIFGKAKDDLEKEFENEVEEC